MIFVTLGSQKFQFNRLLKAVDELQTDEVIFAQIGYSDYEPQNFQFSRFLDRDQFADFMSRANIVITHGGTGAIIGALKRGKKVIAVPRLAQYGEHVDNHQIQLIEQFKDLNLIYACEDMNLSNALETVKRTEYRTFESNTQRIIDSIEEFIKS